MPKPPNLMERLRRLIETPSVSSVSPEYDQSNAGVIALLADWLETMGFAIDIQELAGHPGKSNLIATLGSGPDGLVLAGHTDTVPYDEGRWRHDPFRLTEADRRLYGLGTSDMKAFFALAMEAAGRFDPARLRRPLILVATADEESSMAGARALVDARKPQAAHAIIGEPTGLRPVRTHKGIMMEAIRLVGRSGHSSDPSLGVSALEGMHRAIGELLAWRAELQARHNNPLFAVPVPTLNLGHIHGGDNPNRICASCELHIDIRPLPGMDLDELRALMHRRLADLLRDSGLTLETRRLFEGTPAMETPADAPIVRAAEQLTGYSAQAVAFGTEGPYLNEIGMNTVILGPGDIAQAHQPDEFLALERVVPAVDLMEKLIGEFCCGDRA